MTTPSPGSFGPVTQTDIVRFAGAGGDFNPLHHDASFAQAAGFDAPIAMGQFTAALLAGWLTDWCGVENLHAFEVQFKAPVKIGDVVGFSAVEAAPGSDPAQPSHPRQSLDLTAAVEGNTVVVGRAVITPPAANSTSGDDAGAGTADTGHGDRQLMWTPSTARVEGSRMLDFQRWAADHRGATARDYASLHQWSVTDLEGFWGAVWEYFGVEASVQPDLSRPGAVLANDTMPGASWFPGVKLNYAENMLRHAADRPDEIAIVGEHEQLAATALTWGELEAQVAALAAELRRLGVEPGDTVAAVLPHIPQAVVALLATASVGAVWSVVNTDFGSTGVADRFAQIEPKILLTVDGYEFGGKLRDMTGSIPELLGVLPTVQHVIVADQFPDGTCGPLPEQATRFSEIMLHSAEPSYEQVSFDHPLWVLYSSGTTGKPKGIVHSHGGVLLEALKANGLHYDLGPETRAYFAVSTTWVVWNMVVDTMSAGGSIITYDGSPLHDGAGRHFELISRHRATFFGTGAAVLTMIEKAGIVPNARYDLTALTAMMVTGSPLPDPTWDWVYRAVGNDLRVGSDSGGTDVATAFIGSNPLDPVFRGELMGACLGVAAESWDQHGNRVHNEVGEFVVTRPMPSMPIRFWNDPDGTRYFDAYFGTYPGVWRHGDWVTELDGGEFIIHGRSDSTINRGGIRMGSADITHAVDQVQGVSASMVIGAELAGGDYYMPLFVVPTPGRTVDQALKDAIVAAVRTQVSPRYVPDEIIEAPAVPKTRTGKLMEVPIKKLFQGAGPETLNRGTAEDATVLDWYAAQAEAFRQGR
ncbi:acetoacetate--CoA ligase [Arthrobacter rhombi]|uniref:acetoacetate--CoA ligase n=1 Tax=Arthrobacter rhombi TaxID=71253 RepID=UPI0031DB8F68